LTFVYRAELIEKIIKDLEKEKLRMEAGTFEGGWKYKFSISLKDYNKLHPKLKA